MDISRELAIQILEYLDTNKNFYFPFIVMNREYSEEDDDFVEIEPNEWKNIKLDDKYQTFQLWENLKNLDESTIEFMAKGFLEKINKKSLELQIFKLVRSYKNACQKKFPDNKKIVEFGMNEFICGKAEAYKDCLEIIKNYNLQSKSKTSFNKNSESITI